MTDLNEDFPADTRRRWMLRLSLVVILGIAVAGAYGVHVLHWGWQGKVLLTLAALAATGILAIAVNRTGRSFSPESAARSRYNRAMLGALVLFAAGALAASLIQRGKDIPGAATWLAPLCPPLVRSR